MMKYSDVEQTEAPEQQYIDTLSPPLFLMLSILIAHAIEVAMHERIVLRSGLAGELVQSHEYLLMLRAIAFSIVPLMFAVALLKGLGQKIDREKLRGPFYSQCYVAAPFALAFGLASVGDEVALPRLADCRRRRGRPRRRLVSLAADGLAVDPSEHFDRSCMADRAVDVAKAIAIIVAIGLVLLL